MYNLHKKRLNKAYKKRLNSLNKHFFNNQEQGIVLFLEYLRYLRDSIILNNMENFNDEIKATVATINAAVAELDSWNKLEDQTKKDFHWSNFCELMKLNMKEWLVPNDSI